MEATTGIPKQELVPQPCVDWLLGNCSENKQSVQSTGPDSRSTGSPLRIPVASGEWIVRTFLHAHSLWELGTEELVSHLVTHMYVSRELVHSTTNNTTAHVLRRVS